MTIGVVQFLWTTIALYGIISQTCHLFGYLKTSVYVLWGLLVCLRGVVGLMIVGLSVGHSCMVMTNYTTLDSIKNRRGCPIPFCDKRRITYKP